LREADWCKTTLAWRAHFSEKHFQFSAQASEQLEFKHLLAQLVAQHCPQAMPLTLEINDHNWPEVLSCLEKEPHLVWILKPSLLNNGQHIKIFTHVDQIEQHFLSNHRLGGEHVLQHYLTTPHLLRGHKYSIRCFIVLTNYAGAYLYPEGYFNVARQPYPSNLFTDLSPHLTNEHLVIDQPNVIQIPTHRFDFFPTIYPQIKSLVSSTIAGLRAQHPSAFTLQKSRKLAIFGFDFMMDINQRAWLLEANHGPCFPTNDNHPLQQMVYANFWREIIQNFIMPIAKQQTPESIQVQSFDSV
jgi:hypothetical protein